LLSSGLRAESVKGAHHGQADYSSITSLDGYVADEDGNFDRGGDDNVATVNLEGNRSLIEAASRSGMEHFIFVSAEGEDPDSPAA
jgi:hypothetical protein